MERTQRFYDCITQIGDPYILDAEDFAPGQGRGTDIRWRRWSGMAAAVALIVGLGWFVTHGPIGMGGSSGAPMAEMPACSAPAASEPACSAPAASAPTADQTEEDSEQTESAAGGTAQPNEKPVDGEPSGMLIPGQEIHFDTGEVGVILSRQEAETLDLPEDLAEAVQGKEPVWLELVEGVYVPVQEPTEIALYPYTSDVGIITDGEVFFAAAAAYLP